MFAATSNGSFNAVPPYDNTQNFSNDIVRLDLTNGLPAVTDSFTPCTEEQLDWADEDLGAGGVLLLPDQPGTDHPRLLVQGGKQGILYVVDRDNMGGFTPGQDSIVQEVRGQVRGLWSTPAYWNNNVYVAGSFDNLKAFSLSGGLLSGNPIAASAETIPYPGASPTISALGNKNGIVWTVDTSAFVNSGPAILTARDANNIVKTLYSSANSPDRDNVGAAVKFVVPTVINGHVYVGAQGQVSVFGLFDTNWQAPPSPPDPGSQSPANSPALPGAPAVIPLGASVDYSQGFSQSQNPGPGSALLQLNGSTQLDDSRLQLTDGWGYEAGSAFYSAPVDIRKFSTDFTFQLSNPYGDGMTFTIQGNGPTALGGSGSSLGYGAADRPAIGNSIAIKFDLDLHSGSPLRVHLDFDGQRLNMTITDQVSFASYFTSFTVDIPALVGGDAAYVGFTAGTGGATSSQKILIWTFTPTSLSGS